MAMRYEKQATDILTPFLILFIFFLRNPCLAVSFVFIFPFFILLHFSPGKVATIKLYYVFSLMQRPRYHPLYLNIGINDSRYDKDGDDLK